MSDDKDYQIQRLSQALETSGRTIKELEKQVANARQMLAISEAEKKQWQQEKLLQERIIKQQMVAADAEKNRLQNEIMELRGKLKAA